MDVDDDEDNNDDDDNNNDDDDDIYEYSLIALTAQTHDIITFSVEDICVPEYFLFDNTRITDEV
jgi:hypothetical protein